MKKTILTLSLYFILTICLSSAENLSAEKIVDKVDRLYRADSSYSEMEMEIVTPHWKRVLKMEGWSLGKEKTFIRILEPLKERGVATLKLDNKIWNFLPKTNKVIKIPPSMMMGSWMGSDFTNDDLVKEYTFLDDFNFGFIKVKDGSEKYLYIKCTPREGVPVVWDHIILTVDKTTYLPVSQKYFDKKGILKRIMNFREVRKFGKRILPSVMELIPLNKKGKKTVMRYIKADFNIKTDKKIFTLRNLRKRI